MNPTPDIISEAAAALKGEVKLLSDKIREGRTLRAAERRFLQSLVDTTARDDLRAEGYLAALRDVREILAPNPSHKMTAPEYQRELFGKVYKLEQGLSA